MGNTYGSIGNQIAGWYARRLLEHAMPVIVLEKFAKIKRLPKNNTRVIEFRRSVPFADATTPLQEGVTPEGSQFSYEDVSVEMRQYGDWSQITDQINDFSKDDVLGDIAEMQGEQIASTREALTWDIVRNGTMRRIPAGTRATTNSTHKYTAGQARQMVVSLQKQKAKKISKILGGGPGYETYPIEAAYIACTNSDMGPDCRDLASGVSGGASTNHFIPVANYGTGTAISENELGRFEDIRYIASPDLDPFYAAGRSNNSADTGVHRSNDDSGDPTVDVYPTIVFGQHAFGCVALRGKGAVMPVVMNPDIPRGGDPLGQRGWAGWKMYFACLILNEAWIYRIETSASSE